MRNTALTVRVNFKEISGAEDRTQGMERNGNTPGTSF